MVDIIRDRQLTFMAGSLAYAAFLSLVPVLVMVLAVAAVVRGEAWVGQLLGLVETQLGPRIAGVLAEALQSDQGMLGASALGVVILLWSATRIFRGLDVAVNEVYGTSSDGFLSTLRDGLVALVALVVAIAIIIGLETAVQRTVSSGLLTAATPIFLWVALTVLLLPIYTVLPDVAVSLGEALPGAVFVGAAWLLLSDAFGLYVAATGQAAGLFGGIILLLTLLWIAMLVLLVGAVVNAVLANRGQTTSDRSARALN